MLVLPILVVLDVLWCGGLPGSGPRIVVHVIDTSLGVDAPLPPWVEWTISVYIRMKVDHYKLYAHIGYVNSTYPMYIRVYTNTVSIYMCIYSHRTAIIYSNKYIRTHI